MEDLTAKFSEATRISTEATVQVENVIKQQDAQKANLTTEIMVELKDSINAESPIKVAKFSRESNVHQRV